MKGVKPRGATKSWNSPVTGTDDKFAFGRRDFQTQCCSESLIVLEDQGVGRPNRNVGYVKGKAH